MERDHNTGADNDRDYLEFSTMAKINWITLLLSALLFVVLVYPYFPSPYVYFNHNPVDVALVTFLGVTNVKPVLALCTVLGGIVGLLLCIPVHHMYNAVLRGQVIYFGRRRIVFLTSGSFWGIVWSSGLMVLWDFICPYPNSGTLLLLFIMYPGLIFGIVVSLVNLIEYYRAKYQASRRGFRIRPTVIWHQYMLHLISFRHYFRLKSSVRLELVPLPNAASYSSSNHSIDLS
ncbi:MAG: hypothetical protein K9W43_03825 [Candidatus Thorarchaeota archaeon]|nr:hypothetical protein [Candidatus Thorarchaeota archaeon]